MGTLYKLSGAGNDFIVLDGRSGGVDEYRKEVTIKTLCDRNTGFKAADGRVGADGVMILSSSVDGAWDFVMEYFNSDGSSGMMCGNGGRCIVAFADFLGIVPANGKFYEFLAADGPHTGEILGRDGHSCTVKLKMKDVSEYRRCTDGWFLDTGTRHFVKFVEDVEAVDIETEGPRYRWSEEFAPIGANVNFVQVLPDGSLKVRTFEKGVEDETLACGTGITASALAAQLQAWHKDADCGIDSGTGKDEGTGNPARTDTTAKSIHTAVHARIDELAVDFTPSGSIFTDVFLTGPAALI